MLGRTLINAVNSFSGMNLSGPKSVWKKKRIKKKKTFKKSENEVNVKTMFISASSQYLKKIIKNKNILNIYYLWQLYLGKGEIV